MGGRGAIAPPTPRFLPPQDQWTRSATYWLYIQIRDSSKIFFLQATQNYAARFVQENSAQCWNYFWRSILQLFKKLQIPKEIPGPFAFAHS